MAYIPGKKLASTYESDQMSDLTKTSKFYMFRELNKTIIKVVKEGMMTMSHQIKNINKETEIIFRPEGNPGV